MLTFYSRLILPPIAMAQPSPPEPRQNPPGPQRGPSWPVPGVDSSLRSLLPTVLLHPIIPAERHRPVLPGGDWLACSALYEAVHDGQSDGQSDAVTATWGIPVVRRLLSLTCRALHAAASSYLFAIAGLSTHRRASRAWKKSLKLQAGSISAVYTQLRARMRSTPLTAADVAAFLQLRSHCGTIIKPRQLRNYSRINVLDCVEHSAYIRSLHGHGHGIELQWPALVTRMLLALEADLVHLICTTNDADSRVMAMQLLTHVLADSGVVEELSWVVRLDSLCRLLQVPRTPLFSRELLSAFCYVCTRWEVRSEDSDQATATANMMSIHGLHESSPLNTLLSEVNEAQLLTPFCVHSRGLVCFMCDLRDGLEPEHAEPEGDRDALQLLMQRLTAMVLRCQCSECLGVMSMMRV
jgi:hypothetical protein